MCLKCCIFGGSKDFPFSRSLKLDAEKKYIVAFGTLIHSDNKV